MLILFKANSFLKNEKNKDVGAVLQLFISYSPKAKGMWTQSLQFDVPLWVKIKL